MNAKFTAAEVEAAVAVGAGVPHRSQSSVGVRGPPMIAQVTGVRR
jgi:hypothetical protein